AISIPNPVAPLTIGRAENFFLNGFVDEVEIFNRALSASEIQAIYNADSAGSCKGLDNTPPTFTSVPQDLTVSTGPGATDCVKFISDASLGAATAIDNFPGQVTITRSG